MNQHALNKINAVVGSLCSAGAVALVLTLGGCASWDVNDPRIGQSLVAAKESQRAFKRETARDVTSKELKPSSDRYLGGEDSLTTREDVKSLVRQR